MRRIVYVSGSRADYGLFASTLKLLAAAPDVDLGVVVTGMHLLPDYGSSVREIEADGLAICGRIQVPLDGTTGAVVARALGQQIAGLTAVFGSEQPDIVLLLGDRPEMIAGALAALYLNIVIAHVHGGELSGTVDEPVRHAISKLAQYHFTSTTGARARLVRMGEQASRVFVTGAPGIDCLEQQASRTRADLLAQAGLADRPVALVVFHPVSHEAADAGDQCSAVMQATLAAGFQVVCCLPNADAGGARIRAAIEPYATRPGVKTFTHLDRTSFASWLRAADVMVGNSSSGIIEAATFGLPVVNVGSRQHKRERNHNVFDCAPAKPAIAAALSLAVSHGRMECRNLYGDGHAGERIVELLRTIPLTPGILDKSNAY